MSAFTSILATLAAAQETAEDVSQRPPAPEYCGKHINSLPCASCARNVARGYRVAAKGGRCWNGAHRDAGTVLHILPLSGNRALCGAVPGLRSYGWEDNDAQEAATCKKCLIKESEAAR